MKKLILLCMFLLVGCTNNQQNEQTDRKIRSGLAYHQAHGKDAVCVASVYLEDDVIQAATLDELTFLSKEEYEGLISSQETTTQKQIASKVENDEVYSQAMEINGSTQTIKENFKAICDYVVGKSMTDLETELQTKTDQEMVDAVSSCTLQSTKGYLETIVEACRKAK